MTAYGMPRQISISASSEGDNNPDIDDDTTVKPIATPEATTTTSNSDKASTKSISTMTDGDDTQTAISPTTNNPILNAAKSPSRRIKATGDAASVIGLQYGSNRVASQAGMTAMGMPRQIVSSTSSATSAEDDGEKAEVFERAKKTWLHPILTSEPHSDRSHLVLRAMSLVYLWNRTLKIFWTEHFSEM